MITTEEAVAKMVDKMMPSIDNGGKADGYVRFIAGKVAHPLEHDADTLRAYGLFCNTMTNKGHAAPTYMKYLFDRSLMVMDNRKSGNGIE